MELINVLAATVAGFAAGAVWYNVLSKHWLEAAGIPCDENGKPLGGPNPVLFGLGFLCQLVVAGMMRHVFAASGVASVGAGIVSGAGIGLFFIAPWIALNNLYGGKPLKLTLIDGGYATVSCALMGLVLTLF
ncbi:DUF1761 domain-containing protein [Tropicibacter sp. S64]|uniref:DUF1761 domain-containing protein n=1 Tax=Tropicibacter sp. S64 TaxID=3415122 RepID=UPI003C7C9EA7